MFIDFSFTFLSIKLFQTQKCGKVSTKVLKGLSVHVAFTCTSHTFSLSDCSPSLTLTRAGFSNIITSSNFISFHYKNFFFPPTLELMTCLVIKVLSPGSTLFLSKSLFSIYFDSHFFDQETSLFIMWTCFHLPLTASLPPDQCDNSDSTSTLCIPGPDATNSGSFGWRI